MNKTLAIEEQYQEEYKSLQDTWITYLVYIDLYKFTSDQSLVSKLKEQKIAFDRDSQLFLKKVFNGKLPNNYNFDFDGNQVTYD